MKKINWLLAFMFLICATTVSTSCNNKKKESTTQQDKTTNAPVEISSDENLKRSVNDVVKGYGDVQVEVKDGVVTLRGSVKQNELQTLIMKVQELKPKKVENQLVIKT